MVIKVSLSLIFFQRIILLLCITIAIIKCCTCLPIIFIICKPHLSPPFQDMSVSISLKPGLRDLDLSINLKFGRDIEWLLELLRAFKSLSSISSRCMEYCCHFWGSARYQLAILVSVDGKAKRQQWLSCGVQILSHYHRRKVIFLSITFRGVRRNFTM